MQGTANELTLSAMRMVMRMVSHIIMMVVMLSRRPPTRWVSRITRSSRWEEVGGGRGELNCVGSVSTRARAPLTASATHHAIHHYVCSVSIVPGWVARSHWNGNGCVKQKTTWMCVYAWVLISWCPPQVYYAQCRDCSGRQAQLMRNGTRATILPGAPLQ